MEALSSVFKVTPPRLQRIVTRKRLIERLELEREKKLILIVGQAAQGKSTLAASWAEASETPSAWMNLGPEDSDSVNLFYLLVQSLRVTQPGCGFSSLLHYPTISFGPRAETPLYRDWSRSIFARMSSPVRIILDGLDRLHPEAPSFRFLQALLEEAPESARLMMLTRTIPPLEIQRMRVNREAAIIGNEDLAFSLDETRAYFRKMHRVTMKTDQVRKIHQATEGWTGGLVIVSEALSRLPEEERNRYILERLSSDFREEAFKYLGEQIFFALPKATQDLLIRSSILNLVDPGFVGQFFEGAGNSQLLFQELSEKNLFVHTIYDSKKGVQYRLHQLFREFLLARFQAELTDEEKRYWFGRAGSLHERMGDSENAIRYFIEGRYYTEALRLIQEIGMSLLRSERTGDLAQWILSLPRNLVDNNPWLLFYLSMSRRFTRAEENLTSLQRAMSLFEQHGDVSGQLLVLAHLIEAYMARGHFSAAFTPLVEKSEEMLESLNPDLFLYERAALWTQLSFGLRLRLGKVRRSLWASQNAYLIAKGLREPTLQATALSHALEAVSFLGEFVLADEVLDKLKKLMETCEHPEVNVIYLIHSSLLLVMKGEAGEASRVSKMAVAEAEKHGLVYLYPVALLYDLIAKVYLDLNAEVVQIANRLIDLASSFGNLFLVGSTELFLGISHYRSGDIAKAEGLLASACLKLSPSNSGSPLHINIARVAMGMIRNHLDEPHDSEGELQEALSYFDHESCFFMVDALLAIALLKWKQGRREEAAPYLEAGFKIARDKSYDHLIFVSPNDHVKACTLALEIDLESARDYVTRLLTTRLAPHAESELQRLSHHPDPKIVREAWALRKAVHRSQRPAVHIEALGRFEVCRGEAPLDKKDWEGTQPKLLLKALLAHGSRRVPCEVIMEELWPEADPSSVEKRLKVNLHRLRKALEPEMHSEFGSTYIHLDESHLSLDKSLCTVDVEEFLSLARAGEQEDAAGQIENALSFYRQAAGLYKGDFLPEELYLPWVESRREWLQGLYIRLLKRMAEIYEGQGKTKRAIECNRKLIETDGLNEEAYRRLMVLYFNRGMRSDAIRVYEHCKRVLQTELDLEPDEMTTSIFRRITEKE